MKIHFLKKQNNLKEKNQQLSLNFYWQVAVVATLVTLFGAFYFGYYFFTQTNQEFVLTASQNGDTEVPTVKKENMQKVLNYFSQREQKTTEILNSPAPAVDPSL